jgi:hypothetical protein
MRKFISALAVILVSSNLFLLFVQQPCLARQAAGSLPDHPPKQNRSTTEDAHAQLNGRGAEGMGFSQTATTHHFVLSPDGGVIQVETNNSADAGNRDRIRMHLSHIAHAFANGDFDIPMFVHDTVPPGVADLKRLRGKIRYSVEQTPNGGRVVINTSDKRALAALHAFLRFQIQEHHTH